MTILTTMAARAIAQSYDFSTFKSVGDIGGGQDILNRVKDKELYFFKKEIYE